MQEEKCNKQWNHVCNDWLMQWIRRAGGTKIGTKFHSRVRKREWIRDGF